MKIRISVAVIACLIGAQQTSAQGNSGQPGLGDLQILAEAYDRCMATQGVRLTTTSMSDEAIFVQALQSCSDLHGRLSAALKAQLSPRQAGDVFRTMTAQAKPKFMTMLAQIRTDRVSLRSTEEGSSAPFGQSSLDPANPAHCEIAFSLLVSMTEIASPAHVPEARRLLAVAKAQAARMRPEDAVAARKAAWPLLKDQLLKDQSATVSFAQACTKAEAR
jgi:hypothetical protein